MKALVGAVVGALEAAEVAEQAFAGLLPLYATVDPDTYGGAMLLGVKGVCIISHGSSSSTAIVNAVNVARDMVEAGVVDRLRAAVTTD
jgi:phosphate acyltransferase